MLHQPQLRFGYLTSSLIKFCFLAYLVKNGLNKNFQPNLTSSKAHLHNRKSSRSTRKKIKKKSNRLKVVEENETKTKDLNKTTVLCNKNKQNQASKGLFPNPTCKNQAANNLNTSSVIICSARKLISSYSSKDISTSSKNMWKNPKISPRPKTSSGKKAAIHETSDIKIKRQSCPPPLFQPAEQSSVSKNVRLKKVYYSEAQSHMLAGVPSVPPASPLNSKSNDIGGAQLGSLVYLYSVGWISNYNSTFLHRSLCHCVSSWPSLFPV